MNAGPPSRSAGLNRIRTALVLVSVVFGALIGLLSVLGVEAMPTVAMIGGAPLLLCWVAYFVALLSAWLARRSG